MNKEDGCITSFSVSEIRRVIKWAEALNNGEDITAQWVCVRVPTCPPMMCPVWLVEQSEFVDWAMREHIHERSVMRDEINGVALNTREALSAHHEMWRAAGHSQLSPLEEIAFGWATDLLDTEEWEQSKVWLERVRHSLQVDSINPMRVALNVLGANKALHTWCPEIYKIVMGE